MPKVMLIVNLIYQIFPLIGPNLFVLAVSPINGE